MGAGDGRASRHVAMHEVRHQELLRLLVLGYTLRESAIEMKLSYYVVKSTARTPQFLLDLKSRSEEIARRMTEELATTQIEMAQKLEEASSAALEEMMALMGESTGTLKFKVCQDILDRDPKSSRSKRLDVSGDMRHQFINPALLIHAAATARELEVHQARKEVTDGNPSPDNHADSGNGQSG